MKFQKFVEYEEINKEIQIAARYIFNRIHADLDKKIHKKF